MISYACHSIKIVMASPETAHRLSKKKETESYINRLRQASFFILWKENKYIRVSKLIQIDKTNNFQRLNMIEEQGKVEDLIINF